MSGDSEITSKDLAGRYAPLQALGPVHVLLLDPNGRFSWKLTGLGMPLEAVTGRFTLDGDCISWTTDDPEQEYEAPPTMRVREHDDHTVLLTDVQLAKFELEPGLLGWIRFVLSDE